MLSHLNIGKKRTWITYHIDAERNPTGSIVGRIPNKEERSYYKMEVSNYYSTAKLWGTSDKKVSKSSEKTNGN